MVLFVLQFTVGLAPQKIHKFLPLQIGLLFAWARPCWYSILSSADKRLTSKSSKRLSREEDSGLNHKECQQICPWYHGYTRSHIRNPIITQRISTLITLKCRLLLLFILKIIAEVAYQMGIAHSGRRRAQQDVQQSMLRLQARQRRESCHQGGWSWKCEAYLPPLSCRTKCHWVFDSVSTVAI